MLVRCLLESIKITWTHWIQRHPASTCFFLAVVVVFLCSLNDNFVIFLALPEIFLAFLTFLSLSPFLSHFLRSWFVSRRISISMWLSMALHFPEPSHGSSYIFSSLSSVALISSPALSMAFHFSRLLPNVILPRLASNEQAKLYVMRAIAYLNM